MPPTPLQQKLLVACCGCAAVAAALLPGALTHTTPPAPQVLSVGAAHPAPHEAHHRGASAKPVASTSASSLPLPTRTAPTAASSQPTVQRVTVVPHVSSTPELPDPVTALHLASATASTMTITWQASDDAASYRVLLGGVQVARVTSTQATVAWPGSSSRVLVQVAAVDARGVASELRSVVLVRAIAPTPPAPTPTAPATTVSASSAPASPAPAQVASAGDDATAATVDDAGNQLAGVGHNN